MMLGIMRAGRSFRMILDRNDGQRLVTHAFDALVIKIDMSDLNLGRQRVSFDREPVIM
jgi:hypothetical protein